MKDKRIEQFAEKLIKYSVQLKTNENILIEVFDDGIELAKELVKMAYKQGANPFVSLKSRQIQKEMISGCNEQQIKLMARIDIERMKSMDAYICIRGGLNVSEFAEVESNQMNIYKEHYSNPVHFDERVNNTKWCILNYPNNSMAQLSNMSLESFEDFYFKVCTLDYSKMSDAMDNLVNLINKTDRVRIIAKNTDITFSIKDLPGIKCDGHRNVPDGEVYSAPVKDSVNGYITYNTPSVYEGVTFENIQFHFKNGKIIKATSNNTERLNKILDSDEGSRFIGEFAIGVNPYITTPMKDTLFDEKIKGSIHFTPGRCYKKCYNGNDSSIHWDLVQIQTPQYGGGEIWFDDILIRKDGIFTIDELKCLNPENLI